MDSGKGDSLVLSRFTEVYFSLPLKERKLAIIVVDDNPISWKLAYNEIRNRTGLGTTILQRLTQLDII